MSHFSDIFARTPAGPRPRAPWRLSSLGSCAALGLAAFLVASAPALAGEQAVTVTIDNFTFSPPEITVAPGTTVTWVNHDDIPHTIVNANQAFRSKTLDTDDSFSFTFQSEGEYKYFCSLHPHMTGKVTVKPGAT